MFRIDPAERGARAVNQQGAEIDLATFANPEQPGLAARGVFARDEAKPGCSLTPVFDVCRIGHGSQDGSGCQWPNARNSLHPLTYRMRSSQRLELVVIVCDAFLQGEKLLIEGPEHLCAQRRELRLFGFNLTHNRGAKLGHTLRQNNPILAQEPMDLMD
jgi:hypothetical protein